MTVIWSSTAIRHLASIRQYIGEDSEKNAALVAARILAAISLLKKHPEIGRPGRISGTRELVIPRTPYIVPYRVREDRLELLAVFDGHRHWPTAF